LSPEFKEKHKNKYKDEYISNEYAYKV